MTEALQLLKKYWNHDNFRDLQNEIIENVLAQKDTFAQLPTGGGKSICYQIPALAQEGLTLVISPLVSLIKDQVENLQKRNIKAIGLTGGISSDEVSDLLDNCQYGNYKLLYLSPERLQSDWILDRLKNLPINLIAVDEAHCISQWGNDFRPAYLKITNLKEHFPKTPVLALTASATPRVKHDILKILKIEDAILFEKSFDRDNIAYMVFDVEDKLFRMVQILQKKPGTVHCLRSKQKIVYRDFKKIATIRHFGYLLSRWFIQFREKQEYDTLDFRKSTSYCGNKCFWDGH